MLREEIQKMFNFSLTQDEKIWLKPLKDGAWSKDALRLAGELVEHKSNVLHILSNQIPSKQVIAVSIETTSPHWLTCDVRLISVSGPAMELVVEDVKQIASLLSDPAFLKVFHDASFSVSCLESKGFPVINYTDTIVLAQVLQNHAKGSVSLQYLVNHWLGLTLDIFPRYWVSEQVKLTEDHRLFVLEKVRAIHMLYGVLLEQLSLKHLEVVLDRERRALPAIIELQKNGILFNYFGWQKELSKIQLEIEELSLRIHSLLEDKELNLDAPEQLKKALNNIGIILEGTSDEVLVKYEADYEVILLLRKYRRKRKQLSTFGEKLKKMIGIDGRLRGSWSLIGTGTSRMSCINPNLQGMPSISKPYFHAAENHVFIIADYSNIELRILAEISRDAAMIKAFQEGIDVHSKTASAIFAKKLDGITSDERKVGKIINFGLVYGMSKYGLQKKIQAATGDSITLEEAENFRRCYFDAYPGVLDYQDRMLREDSISTLGGRYWSSATSDLKKGSISRFNYPIQSSGAEGFKEGLSLLMDQKPPHWKLVASVHDEVVLEVPVQESERAERLLKQVMTVGMEKLLKTVPVVVEVTVSCFWEK